VNFANFVDRPYEGRDTARYHGSRQQCGYADHQGKRRFAVAVSSYR